MPWHTGRTFYACPRCLAQAERQAPADAPRTLPCWWPDCGAVMTQWVPPAVARERAKISESTKMLPLAA